MQLFWPAATSLFQIIVENYNVFHTHLLCKKLLSNTVKYTRMISEQAVGMLVKSLQQLGFIMRI